jgi:pSer/pThr/pTyr-binding forkhead associated (FHA) protein
MFVQIFVKDVKSANGTFINGELLSPEGPGSEPYELKADNIVICIPVQLVCH